MGPKIIHVICLLSTLMARSSEGKIPDVSDFFPQVRDDLGRVVWSHATNSKTLLHTALNDGTMMIEADILMGTKPESDVAVPIMAHPPASDSDLTAQEFIADVIHASRVHGKRKGIKLDFKEFEAVVPVLKFLQQQEANLTFPVWLNADILQGPVNSTKTPLPAEQFIAECQKYLKEATLSLGWTTRFGRDSFKDSIDPHPRTISEGQYTQQHLDELIQLIDLFDLLDAHARITLPVRAGIAAQSQDILVQLNVECPQCTLTLWSPIDDPLDKLKLERLIDNFGKTKTYIDLPFNLKTGPKVVPDPTYDELHGRGGEYSSSTWVSASLLTFLLLTVALIH